MSYIRRALYKRKLGKLLAKADDEAFFLMVWATHAIQSGRPENARRQLEFPPEAATADLNSKYAVHPWKLETLLNEILTTPKLAFRSDRANRRLNCRQFNAIAHVSNVLSKLENAEDGITLRHVSVLREIHRLGQRQFEWQRGFISYSQFYRAAFIYGGDLTKGFFAEANGFSIEDFMLACFALRVLFLEKPIVRRGLAMDEIGISEKTLSAILNLIAIPHAVARERTGELRSGNGHVSYKRSIFREYPCVAFGEMNERVHAPLPDLLALRATSGVFYDVVKGEQPVRNEVSSRFEQYCLEYLKHALRSRAVRGSYRYLIKNNPIDTPDILVCDQGAISLVLECKATRLSYEARFSENPVADARRAYNEIAKGVFQIWRFASHLRRGLLQQDHLQKDAKGIVLTLDTWLSMANTMQIDVLGIARSMATSRDPEIIESDQISVIFCPIDDLEQTLAVATEKSFFDAVRAATEEKHRGWMLWSVHQDIAPDLKERNDYPFEGRMPEVLPWWSLFADR